MQGPVSESAYVPDSCINPHPRFGTLVRNIRTRRGGKVDIRVPLFRDVKTPEYQAPTGEGSGSGWKGGLRVWGEEEGGSGGKVGGVWGERGVVERGGWGKRRRGRSPRCGAVVIGRQPYLVSIHLLIP